MKNKISDIKYRAKQRSNNSKPDKLTVTEVSAYTKAKLNAQIDTIKEKKTMIQHLGLIKFNGLQQNSYFIVQTYGITSPIFITLWYVLEIHTF